jgi:hypothetical protein
MPMTMRIGPPSLPPVCQLFITARRGHVEIRGTREALAQLAHEILDLANADDGADEAAVLSRRD